MKTIVNLKYDMYDIYFTYKLPVGGNLQIDEYITSRTQIEDALKLAKVYKKNWTKQSRNRQACGYYCVIGSHNNVIAIY